MPLRGVHGHSYVLKDGPTTASKGQRGRICGQTMGAKHRGQLSGEGSYR